MSVSDKSAREKYEVFSQGAALQLLLPGQPDIDLEDVLQKRPQDLASVSTRRNLFFDEKVTIFLVLKTTSPNSESLEQLLPNLEVTLSSHATDAVPQGSGIAAPASDKHNLVSRSFAGGENPEVISVEGDIYVVWRPTLHLPWPRVRLQRPAIYFTASVNLDPKAATNTRRVQPVYLKSYEPLPANVLEPLQFEPSLAGSNVYLSEDRITKMAPSENQSEERVKPIRGASKRAFPTVPALFTRLRYSRLPDTVLISLHLETAQVIAGTVTVKEVSLEAAGFNLTQLNPLTRSQPTHPGDELIVVFQANPIRGEHADQTPPSPTRLTAHVQASADLDQGSHINLDIRWHTQTDLSPIPPRREYKWSTTPPNPITNSTPEPTNPPRTTTSSDSTTTIPRTTTTTHPETSPGITFSITAPRSVASGSDFTLRIQSINHSNHTRNFSLYMLPPPSVAQKSKPPDVLPLDAETRIGPLPARACYETLMRLRAVAGSGGVLDFGGLRVVDLDADLEGGKLRVVDVGAGDLPDVVVV